MWNRLSAAPSFGKWCAYVALLLMPGSFFVLPVLWAARMFRPTLAAKFAARPRVSAARA